MTLIRFQDNAATSECYVSFRYDAGYVEALKDLVPGRLRSFDPASKVWTVPLDYADRLREAASDNGHEIEGVVPRPRRSDHYPKGEGGFFGIDDDEGAKATAAALIDSITPDRRGAVFREMGKILYPEAYGKRRKR